MDDSKKKELNEIAEAIGYEVHWQPEDNLKSHDWDKSCWCEPECWYDDPECDRVIYIHKYVH